MMRWGYLIPRIVIMAVVWSFFAYAFDPMLRWSFQKTGEKINGAKVDVADLETVLFPPALELHNLQVADRSKPGRNLLEWETFRVKFAGGPLAHRKLVVEEGEITGLMWNTPRSDSGEIDKGESFSLGEHINIDGLRKKVSELGKNWLKDAVASAKADVDPENLETVRVSLAVKEEWLKRFQSYEARVKDLESRVKALKEFDPEGSTLEKINAYRQAALEVQRLIKDAQTLRGELTQLGPSARVDLAKIEAAQKRDLAKFQQKLNILKMDREAISEALLGPELLAVLEEALQWASWTRDKAGRLTKIKEPERSRGVDVSFDRPEDPHPSFLIKNLKIAGTARVNGEMVPYSGTIANITSDPEKWGEPVIVDLEIQGRAEVHLTARIDRTQETPAYQLALRYHLPEPMELAWGGGDLAFRLHAPVTTWTARFDLVGESLSGRVSIQQPDVRITAGDASAEAEPIQPVGFAWNSEQELKRALAGVFATVRTLEANVDLSGSLKKPEWKFSSSVGQHVATGVESYLRQELNRRQAQWIAEVQRKTDEELAGFRNVIGEKFRAASGRINLTESEAGALVQRFAGRPLDVRGFFR